MKIFTLSAIAGVLLAAAAANASPILDNGSFELGFTGWSLTGDTSFSGVDGGGVDGSYQAFLGSIYSENYLSQTFADTSGQSYNLSFWLASDGGSPSHFSVDINGTAFLSFDPVPYLSYTQYTYNFTGTGLDTLTFTDANVPAYNYIDNVSVTAAAPPPSVPEPGTLPLLATGLLAFLMLRRRKNFAG
jgi:hypothetical protein